MNEASGSTGTRAAAAQPELSEEAAAPPPGEKRRRARADGASSSAVNAMGAVLWVWLSRCMERTAVLSPQLLRDAVVAKVDRIQLLAILTGKEAAAVEGLHLSEAVLGARVVDATLPLLAVFEAAGAKMPMTAPKDLTDVPGMFAVLSLEPGAFGAASEHCAFVVFVEQHWQQIQAETRWDGLGFYEAESKLHV